MPDSATDQIAFDDTAPTTPRSRGPQPIRKDWADAHLIRSDRRVAHQEAQEALRRSHRRSATMRAILVVSGALVIAVALACAALDVTGAVRFGVLPLLVEPKHSVTTEQTTAPIAAAPTTPAAPAPNPTTTEPDPQPAAAADLALVAGVAPAEPPASSASTQDQAAQAWLADLLARPPEPAPPAPAAAAAAAKRKPNPTLVRSLETLRRDLDAWRRRYEIAHLLLHGRWSTDPPHVHRPLPTGYQVPLLTSLAQARTWRDSQFGRPGAVAASQLYDRVQTLVSEQESEISAATNAMPTIVGQIAKTEAAVGE